MTTLATFLSEKAGNMKKWLEAEGLERIRAPTDIEIVTFAVLCATDLKTVIRERLSLIHI